MKKGDSSSKLRGFTIIEVALVIAIAGLIFLMVFVALPGLRASQRDAERREDITSMLESVKKYQTNNRGALPTGTGEARHMTEEEKKNLASVNTWQNFYNDYLGDNFFDPNGEYYTLMVVSCGAQADSQCKEFEGSLSPYTNTFPNGYRIMVVLQATCKDQNAVGTNNPRKIAAVYRLEGSGVYCANT